MSEEKNMNAVELNDEILEDVDGGKAKYYVVQKGDTLTKIANRFGVTRTRLMSWNSKITDPDYIQAGWKIRVG